MVLNFTPIRCFTAFLVTAVVFSGVSFGATYYVATNGLDTDSGTLSKPWQSFSKANTAIKAGDTVLVRGGTYTNSKITINKSGTATAPIIFQAYPGEKPVLDGSTASIPFDGSVLFLSSVQYVVVDGFEVCNSKGGRGVTANGTNVTLRNCKVHSTYSKAILALGENIIIENNEVWNAGLANADHVMEPGGWPAIIQTYCKSSTTPSKNITMRNNYVHDCWGEGLAINFVDGAVVSGNTVRDCFSVLIYSDNGQNVTINANYCYVTTDKYNRQSGARPIGIMFSSENYSGVPALTASNIVISNNLILETHNGISRWHDPANTKATNTYNNVSVFYNVIKDCKNSAIYFNSTGSQPAPFGCVMKNNIIFGTNALSIGNLSAWTFSHNNWVNAIPSSASGTGNFTGDPSFVDPVVGGSVDGFKLKSTSKCIGKGTTVAEPTKDFWGNARSGSTPCIGLHEYSAAVSVSSISPKKTVLDAMAQNERHGVEIYDVRGRVVSSQSIEPISCRSARPPGDMKSGMYLQKMEHTSKKSIVKQ